MKTGRHFRESLANLRFSWREVILVCFVATLSYGAAKLGGTLIIGQQPEWPLWLGNAFLASILLLVPRRMWPILIATAFSASFLFNVQGGLSIRLSALLVLSDTVEVLAAALCLSHAFGGAPRLNNLRALAKFSLFAVILPPSIGAFFVALAANRNYWTSWRIYFFSEAIVYLTLMPAIVGWFGKGPTQREKSRAYYLEAAGLIAGLLAFGYLTFDAPWKYSTEALLYSIVPFMLWSALRFGSTGVSTSAIAIAVLLLWGAAHNRGPFIESQLLKNALSLQLFLFFTAAPFMVLAAVVEENRQANEQLFRSIFENARIGIGIFKIQTGEHFTNRATHEILGYSQEELSRIEQWDEIVPAEERAACAQRYADLVQGKRDTDEYEQHLIHRTGRLILGNSRFRLLRDSAGKPQYVVALTEDITERVKAEEALAASERLFRTIFENAQIGISVVNISAQQYHTNRALHEMLGCTSEDLSSVEKWDLMVHPDERESGAKRYAALVAGKLDRDEWEQRFVRPDGRLVIVNGRFSVLRDAAGKALYVLNLSEDITERRRAADALAASEQLFHTVFDNAQIAIGILNTKTGEHVNNRAVFEMFGNSHEELRRTEQWDTVVHADDRASGAQRYTALVQGKADKDAWEQRYMRRDGKVVIGDCRFKLVRDPVGEPHYVVGLCEDVTEHRRAENELREAHETLARQLLAINNELELARQTQLSLLPKNTPNLPDLEIAARYMPMSAVAGDFYDFIVVDEKHVGILIADVSGHGLSAALVASMLKSALSAQVPHASDPARVLSGLNQALFGKFETHFVTAAYVFVDMANKTVSYAGAAHPPLLWWHARTQEVSECLANGLMLGPFRDSTYSAMTFAMEKGDEIILVTDGILEARDSLGEQFGMDRLRTAIESSHALSANTYADALLAGLSTWSEAAIGPGQTDDITLIVAGFQA